MENFNEIFPITRSFAVKSKDMELEPLPILPFPELELPYLPLMVLPTEPMPPVRPKPPQPPMIPPDGILPLPSDWVSIVATRVQDYAIYFPTLANNAIYAYNNALQRIDLNPIVYRASVATETSDARHCVVVTLGGLVVYNNVLQKQILPTMPFHGTLRTASYVGNYVIFADVTGVPRSYVSAITKEFQYVGSELASFYTGMMESDSFNNHAIIFGRSSNTSLHVQAFDESLQRTFSHIVTGITGGALDTTTTTVQEYLLFDRPTGQLSGDIFSINKSFQIDTLPRIVGFGSIIGSATNILREDLAIIAGLYSNSAINSSLFFNLLGKSIPDIFNSKASSVGNFMLFAIGQHIVAYNTRLENFSSLSAALVVTFHSIARYYISLILFEGNVETAPFMVIDTYGWSLSGNVSPNTRLSGTHSRSRELSMDNADINNTSLKVIVRTNGEINGISEFETYIYN